MKVISFLPDYALADRIINHLKLTFVAECPPPPQHLVSQEFLMAANGHPSADSSLEARPRSSRPERKKEADRLGRDDQEGLRG